MTTRSAAPNGKRVHAFRDDALGAHDAVALAELVRRGEVSPQELAAAAVERARSVEPQLHAIAYSMLEAPRYAERSDGALHGVPTFVKDNTDLRGVPSNHGSEAFTARPAKRDGYYARQYLSTGMTVLGKSRLPEFGF
ncbi:MAG TPA: amidase family protein, partial [Jatrophihabitans sp.]|nr:amidase family protein [Jatrophihabitans sp.]